MAKNVTMKKGESIIKCVEDHVEHFEKNGYKVHEEKAVSKKSAIDLPPIGISERKSLILQGIIKE